MRKSVPAAETRWLLSGETDNAHPVDAFLAAPLLPPRPYSRDAGQQVLDALTSGTRSGTPPVLVLAAAQSQLGGQAAALCGELLDAVRQGAPLARALSGHPSAFGPRTGALLEAHAAVAPLSAALGAVRDAGTPSAHARAQLGARRRAVASIAGVAVLAGVVATLLTPSLGPSLALVGRVVQVLAGLSFAYGAVVLASAYVPGRLGRAGAWLVDPRAEIRSEAAASEAFRTMAALIEAGAPERVALRVASQTCPSARAARALGRASDAAWAGDSLSTALASQDDLGSSGALAGALTTAARASALRDLAARATRRSNRLYLWPPAALCALAWAGALTVCVAVP